MIAFSLSFEEDDVHVLALLDAAGLPLRAADRDERHPLVVGGGIAVQINPEPLAPFFDAFLVGRGRGAGAAVPRLPARGGGRAAGRARRCSGALARAARRLRAGRSTRSSTRTRATRAAPG